MLGRCFLVVAFLSYRVSTCSGESLDTGLSEKISAFAGETVNLPCHIPPRQDIPTVEWSKAGLNPSIIFLYRDGCETFEMKNPLFKYRTNLNMSELKNGDISLIISNVELKDAGKYQCVILRKNNPQVIKTLELVVGAVSEPKLTVIAGESDGVTLQCEANCWFPEPEVTFHDDQGNGISAETAKRSHDARGCFTVTRRVTVQTNRVTCRVYQHLINKTRETEKYIPAQCLRSCTVTIITTFLGTFFGLCLLAILIKILKSATRNIKSGKAGGANHHTCNSENVTTDHLQKIKELEDKLHSKDARIHQLTEQLNELRQVPALQPDQPTVNNDPLGSSPDTSQPNTYHTPHQLPHDNTPKPGNASRNKDFNPAILGQDPALGSPVQTSSNNHNGPAPSTDNAAPSSSSSSPSMSEENHLFRSKSLSQPRSRDATLQRRYTISAASPNRFSLLPDFTEESEMLLTHEQE